MRRAGAILVAIALAGCAASRSGPSKVQLEYVKTHPLSPDEERRLYAREAKRGDTVDRVKVTFDDCAWLPQAKEGALSVFRVEVPIDARPIRLDTDKLEEIPAGGAALLTFENDRLKSALAL